MNPIRFGSPGRQLFGIYQPPSGGADRQTGVLLCNPFGQEAIRSHRLRRVLADHLAREGFHVLRFDYFGTGDSGGDDASGDLDGWCDDIVRADEELLSRSRRSRSSWIGLRLGASLAALASGRAPRVPQSLILWDPVIDGAGYLAELANAHIEARKLDFGPRWKIESRLRAMISRESESEAFGFPLTPALKSHIGALSASSFAAARSTRVKVFYERESGHVSAFVQVLEAHAMNVSSLRIETGINWTSNEAMNSAIVPAAALNGVLDAFRGEL